MRLHFEVVFAVSLKKLHFGIVFADFINEVTSCDNEERFSSLMSFNFDNEC